MPNKEEKNFNEEVTWTAMADVMAHEEQVRELVAPMLVLAADCRRNREILDATDELLRHSPPEAVTRLVMAYLRQGARTMVNYREAKPQT